MKLTWRQGGTAEIVAFEAGDRVVLLSTIPAAPGTPLDGTSETGERHFVKVRTSKKISDAPLSYRVEGRLYNFTREQRERLQGLFRGAVVKSPS